MTPVELDRDLFTQRVSELLSDPSRLDALLKALAIDARDYPDKGCFTGRCPFCKTADTFFARYRDTERSPYPVFWGCRNAACAPKGRHSSALGLVRELLGLSVRQAADWLADHLGYPGVAEVMALTPAIPTREAVVLRHLGHVAAPARRGYAVYWVGPSGFDGLDFAALFRFKRLTVDSDISEQFSEWSKTQDWPEKPNHEPAIKKVDLSPPTTEFRSVKKLPGYRLGSDGTLLRENCYNGTWAVEEPEVNARGEAYVTVSRDGTVRRYSVARLVLEAFVGPAPSPKSVPVHRDGRPLNNEHQNLAWDEKTKSSNKGERHGRAKLKDADIVEMFELRHEGKTLTEIARLKGVSLANVSNVINRKTWTHVPVPRLANAA